jgi:hypothetical protein
MRNNLFMGGCLAVALLATIGGSVSAMTPPTTGCEGEVLPDPSRENKVTLCHFTGSESNPFVINEVSASAADAHTGHHGDCVNDGNSTVCY